MPYRRLVRVACLGAAALLVGPGCDDKERQAPAAAAGPAPVEQPLPRPTHLDSARAPKLIADGALVLDVREQAEWNGGHLAQAKLVPLGTIEERLAEIEQLAGGKDKPIVLYCRTGSRSGQAKQKLEAAGFTAVVNGGGYRALSTSVPPPTP